MVRRKERRAGTGRTRAGGRKIKKEDLQLVSLCLPGFLLLLLFAYLPMFGLTLAFKDYKFSLGFWNSEWAGFKNFRFFFQSSAFPRLLRNTLGLNLLFLHCNTFITVVLALLLYEVNHRRMIRAVQTVVFLPFVVSWVAASYALYANISEANGIFRFVWGKPVAWYSTPGLWPGLLLVCYLWKNMGYGIIIYYGNLLAIDKSYFEAAKLDGASRWQIMYYISLPFIRPIVIMFFILSLGRIFSADFGMFYYMSKNSSLLYDTTDVIDTYVYRALRVTGDVGMSAAIGLFQSVVGFAVLIAANRIAAKIDSGGTVL